MIWLLIFLTKVVINLQPYFRTKHIIFSHKQKQMKYGFFLLIFSLFMAIFAYVIIRGYQSLPTQGYWKQLYAGVSVLGLASFLTALFVGHKMNTELASSLAFTGNTYFIVLIYLFIAFVLADLVRATNAFAHFAPAGMVSFRYWWFIGSITVIVITLIVGNYRFNHPVVVPITIQIAKPKQNKELKIVAISDLHIGFSIKKKQMQQYVKLINAQHPDIVLIAGDFSDRSIEPVIRQNIKEELLKINAPMGIFGINGNHELFAERPNATAEYLRSAGITVLIDSVVLVNNSFYVVGREDYSDPKRQPLASLTKELDMNLPVILLDHQPHHLEEAQQNHIDLQVSGHTHGGQFFPGNFIVKNMFEQAHGYLHKGNTHYYVSSGIGIWGPQYRIGTQSELAVITMKY